MIPVTITLNIEETRWPDVGDVPQLHEITRIGRLPLGTVNGNSTVTILAEAPDGSRFLAQTSLKIFWCAACALKAAAEKGGECVEE